MPNTIIISKMEDAPCTLIEQAERSRRKEMSTLPHIKLLADYVDSIKTRCGEIYQIPHFDPCDGGIYAGVLFLLEAPGPQAVETAFVSRNNPDPTARNLWHLMEDAHILRSDTLIWNIVPWYVGKPGHIRPVTKQDVQEAVPYLRELLALLPCLQVIVLVGKQAQSAKPLIRILTTLPIVPTYHPSARVFNRWPDKKRLTQEAFADVAQLLLDNKEPNRCPNH